MSYRVGVEQRRRHADSSPTATATSARCSPDRRSRPDTFYQLIIVKQTTTPRGQRTDSTDPYAPPFDTVRPRHASAGRRHDGHSRAADVRRIGVNDQQASRRRTTARTPKLAKFLDNVNNGTPAQERTRSPSRCARCNDDGTLRRLDVRLRRTRHVSDDSGLAVNSTGSAHLLIGAAFDDDGNADAARQRRRRRQHSRRLPVQRRDQPDGHPTRRRQRRRHRRRHVATTCSKAGIVGCWIAQYDPNGVVNNPFDQNAVAISTNQSTPRTSRRSPATSSRARRCTSTATRCRSRSSAGADVPAVDARLQRRHRRCCVQRRRLPAGGDQPVEHGRASRTRSSTTCSAGWSRPTSRSSSST